jgi:hypothetical protein
MERGFVTLVRSPIAQAFLGSGATALVIHIVSGAPYDDVLNVGGRNGGDGIFVSAVFLGILGYRLWQQYIARLPRR